MKPTPHRAEPARPASLPRIERDHDRHDDLAAAVLAELTASDLRRVRGGDDLCGVACCTATPLVR